VFHVRTPFRKIKAAITIAPIEDQSATIHWVRSRPSGKIGLNKTASTPKCTATTSASLKRCDSRISNTAQQPSAAMYRNYQAVSRPQQKRASRLQLAKQCRYKNCAPGFHCCEIEDFRSSLASCNQQSKIYNLKFVPGVLAQW